MSPKSVRINVVAALPACHRKFGGCCIPLVGGPGNGVAAYDFVADLKGVAVLGDLIVGIEAVTLDEKGPGALKAQSLPPPKEPTPAARAAHNFACATCDSV